MLSVFSFGTTVTLGAMACGRGDVTDVRASVLKVKYSCKPVTASERLLGLPRSVASTGKTK